MHTQRQATELIVKVNMINFCLIYAVNVRNNIYRNKIRKEVESADFIWHWLTCDKPIGPV